jgi:hypothetical protein
MTASPQIDAYTRDGIKIKSTVSAVFSLSEEPDTIFVTYLGDLSEHNPENVRAVLTDKRVQERGESSEYVASLFKLDLEDAYEVLKSLETADDHSEIGSINRTHPVKFQPFPFDADRVIRASYYLPYTAQGKTAVAWDELPLMVAVEAFRNKIAQYTYDYMHMPDDPDNFPLKRIRQEFSFSLRSKGILKYQVVFRRDGQPINENQAWNMGDILASAPRTFKNPQVLRERGIKVILANFGEFTPPDQVREELIANWRARWEKEINSRLAHRDLEAARIRNRARVKAQQDTSSFVLSEVFSGMPFSEEALTVRVFQALETAATDLGEARLLPHDTINMLWSLYQWMVREEGKPDETGSSPEDNMPGGL